MNSKSLIGACALLCAFAACGGKTDDGGSDAATDATPVTDAQPSTGCPDYAMPKDGSACSEEGLKCEYGSDPRWTCNWIAYCHQGRWSDSTTNDAWCPTPAQNPASCPATFASVPQGSECTSADVPCQYPQGWCSCMYWGGPPMPDGGGPTYAWQCSYGTSTGCPATRPRIGTSCSMPDLECDYGVCDQPSGLSVRCDGSTHTWADGIGAPCAGAYN